MQGAMSRCNALSQMTTNHGKGSRVGLLEEVQCPRGISLRPWIPLLTLRGPCWWQSKGFCSPSGRPDGPDMRSGGASWVAAVSTLHRAGL